jgi:ribosomal protein S17
MLYQNFTVVSSSMYKSVIVHIQYGIVVYCCDL